MLNLRRLCLALFFVCAGTVFTAAQECSLKPDQAPVLRGFRLGMTPQELQEKVVGVGGLEKADEVGMTETTIYPFQMKSKEDASGIQYVKLTLLDKRLTAIELRYDGSTDWDGVDQFAAKISESLQLPKMSKGRFGFLRGSRTPTRHPRRPFSPLPKARRLLEPALSNAAETRPRILAATRSSA
jgi:hypothetical protein